MTTPQHNTSKVLPGKFILLGRLILVAVRFVMACAGIAVLWRGMHTRRLPSPLSMRDPYALCSSFFLDVLKYDSNVFQMHMVALKL